MTLKKFTKPIEINISIGKLQSSVNNCPQNSFVQNDILVFVITWEKYASNMSSWEFKPNDLVQCLSLIDRFWENDPAY